MKNFLFFVPLALLCTIGHAQIKATTEDGREVLLHGDGTWEFADSGNIKEEESSGNQFDPQKVINEHCQEEWTTDFEMQAYCRKKQVESLNKLVNGRPSDVSESQWDQIFGNCWAEWENDFEMTEYCVGKQIEGLRTLR